MSDVTTKNNLPLLNIVLYEPEIPPNTGNIIRLAANTGARLHLIEPVAFELDDKRLRRAGLDYGEWQDMQIHKSWQQFLDQCQPETLYAISTKGSKHFHHAAFKTGDFVVFGPETRGLPDTILDRTDKDHTLRIPMRAGSRSMNLSNAVSVITYEAWRQMNFNGAQ